MKPRRPHPLAAIPEAVLELVNRFDYPDVDPLPAPFIPSGKGGVPTVVIAASDATDLSKGKADFVCTGTNDDQVVQEAIDIIDSGGSDGGTIWLSEGNFFYDKGSGDSTFAFATDITIRGVGRPSSQDVGTSIYMRNTNSSSRGFAGGGDGGVTIRDLGFFGEELGTAIDLGGGRAINVHVEAFEVGVALDQAELHDSIVHICEFDVFCDQRVTIVNNLLGAASGFTAHGIGGFCDAGSMIVNNVFGDSGNDPVDSAFTGGIFLDQAADRTLIIGNEFYLAGNDPGIALWLSGAYGCIIMGNYFDLDRADGIVLDDTPNVVQNNIIAANSLNMELPRNDDTYDGIRIDGDDNMIQHNMLRGSAGANKPRYGINIASGDDNIVVGNDLGTIAEWATDALNDAGTGTRLVYPNDATYGDNFTL